MFGPFKQLIYTLMWSNQPAWLSPPLRKTRLVRGKYVTRVWMDKSLRTQNAKKAYLGLGTVDISYIQDRNDITLIPLALKTSATDCREHLVKCLAMAPLSDMESSNVSANLLRLDLAITEMFSGLSLFDNLFFPFFLLGFGHAIIQVEGIVTEVESNRPLVKFVERRRNSGLKARGGWRKPKTKFERTMVGGLLSEASYNIIRELNALFVRD